MSLVVFDLDNTLINGQSQYYLLLYSVKRKRINFIDALFVFIWFFLYKLNLVKDPRGALSYAYRKMLRGKRTEEIEAFLSDFCDQVLFKKINQKTIERLKQHQKRSDRIILMSNALKPLAKIMANFFGIRETLATEPQEENGYYTGKINNEIVYGGNKEKLIKQFVNINEFSDSYVYADHFSDLPLFKLVKFPVAVNPDKKLLKYAKAHNWEIID